MYKSFYLSAILPTGHEVHPTEYSRHPVSYPMKIRPGCGHPRRNLFSISMSRNSLQYTGLVLPVMISSATYPARLPDLWPKRTEEHTLFHFHQIVDCSLVFDDKCEFVNPFVHSIVTDDLSAIQSSCLLSKVILILIGMASG